MKECSRLLFAVEMARELRATLAAAALDNPTDPRIAAAWTYSSQALAQSCNALAQARRRCTCGAVACTGAVAA